MVPLNFQSWNIYLLINIRFHLRNRHRRSCLHYNLRRCSLLHYRNCFQNHFHCHNCHRYNRRYRLHYSRFSCHSYCRSCYHSYCRNRFHHNRCNHSFRFRHPAIQYQKNFLLHYLQSETGQPRYLHRLQAQ